MITKNQSKLILKGIGLHKKAQRQHNAGKYTEARKTKIESNRILDGFSGDIVAEHFALFSKGKR